MTALVLLVGIAAITSIAYLIYLELQKQKELKQKQRLARMPKRVPVIPPKRNSRPNLGQLTKQDTGYKRPSWQNAPPTPHAPPKPTGSTPLMGTPPPPEWTPPQPQEQPKPIIPDTFKPPAQPFQVANEMPSAHTSQKLMELVNGNRKLAKRLVSSAKIANPDKSDRWCVEKVVWDLERDRT